MKHELFDGNIRLLDAGDGAVDNFLQIMGRNIGRHTEAIPEVPLSSNS